MLVHDAGFTSPTRQHELLILLLYLVDHIIHTYQVHTYIYRELIFLSTDLDIETVGIDDLSRGVEVFTAVGAVDRSAVSSPLVARAVCVQCAAINSVCFFKDMADA